MNADRTIVVVGAIAGTIIGVNNVIDNKPVVKPLLGLLGFVMLLALLRYIDNGKVTKPLAVLFLIAVLFQDGLKLIHEVVDER